MTAAVEWHDTGLSKLLGDLEQLNHLKVTVGYQDAEGREIHPGSTITIALLGAIHEWGSKDAGIPGRSYFRRTVLENETAIADRQREAIKAIVESRLTPVAAMSTVGEFVCGLIRAKLLSAESWAVPLKPETVEKRKSNDPLEDTKALADNLSWAVREGRRVHARGH